MPNDETFETDVRTLIDQGQVVVVVGSGVSIATSLRAPTWRKLIDSAVERCRALGAAEAWCEAVAGQLALVSEPDMLLSAAELVHQKLREKGEFGRWLRDSFEGLQPEDPRLIEILDGLGAPLLTTNYDDLIEKVTSLKQVTWTDSRRVARVGRGDDRRVLHLHGHWDEPESVVLGIRSYEAVKDHRHTQAVMQAFGITKSFLFVGCGDEGLADPNFGNSLTWLEAIEKESKVEHRHYRLVRAADTFEPQGRLFPLVYGDCYDDLVPFLERLHPQPAARRGAEEPEKAARRVLSRLPESVEHYLKCLAQRTEHLTMLGMGRSLQVELPIDEAYVPLKTTLARSLDERKTDRFKPGHAEHEEDVDLGLRGVILLGEPGSGKTTGARQLTWRLASRQSLPVDLGLPAGITPVLLRFRNLTEAILSQKRKGLRTFLDKETQCATAPEGLDEVVDPDARKKVSDWVRQAMRDRPGDRFLVTCRFQGYYREGVPLGPKFVEFHVQPLDDGQVERFVRGWFSAAYAKLLGPGPRARAQAEAKAGDLLAVLSRPAYQAGHIRELSTNPLLLTILCIVFHEGGKLPNGRAELYAHCVRVLLEYWRQDIYQADLGTKIKPYDAEAAQSVLARLAWWMHQEQDRTAAPLDELAEEAAKGLAEVATSSGLGTDGHRFIERMRDEAGILAMAGDGAGRCGFLHLSFQEYLAAEHAAREGFAKQLASKAAESWWREVALLSLRQSRPYCKAFFREMLKAGIAENHPDLAEQCLQETRYLVPDPFLNVLRRSKRPERVAAVLRLVRDRAEDLPGLEKIGRQLAGSEDRQTREFAREILIRRGIEPEAAPAELGVTVDERTGIAFVLIPPGEFQMGSNHGDSDEQPVHRVRISRGFLLAKYPITNRQYARFLEAAGSTARKPQAWDNRRFNQLEQPVVGVSWDDAQAYCRWAGVRLPTEAEWEYACRAGTTTEYSFGDEADRLGEYAWFSENSSGQTQPVGTKKPNPWGLHDMHGNVWEWCQDWFSSDYYAMNPEVDPKGPKQAPGRVFRGGCWGLLAWYCRAAYRYGGTPGFRGNDLGFRVAAVPRNVAVHGDCRAPLMKRVQ
jgi:formylglycine-generating enzyme required for sulfatase activity